MMELQQFGYLKNINIQGQRLNKKWRPWETRPKQCRNGNIYPREHNKKEEVVEQIETQDEFKADKALENLPQKLSLLKIEPNLQKGMGGNLEAQKDI